MTIIRSDIGASGFTVVSRRSPADPLSPRTAFFAIMLAFSVSNGYISTLIMLASVVEPSLDEEEIDVSRMLGH